MSQENTAAREPGPRPLAAGAALFRTLSAAAPILGLLALMSTATPDSAGADGCCRCYSDASCSTGNAAVCGLASAADCASALASVAESLCPTVGTTKYFTFTDCTSFGGCDGTKCFGNPTAPDQGCVNPGASAPACQDIVTVLGGSIGLVKDGSLDLGPNGTADPGDVIGYTFTVTNIGPVIVTDVTVTDPMVPTITCPGGSPIPLLGPGSSVICTGSYAITQADIDAGQKVNTASAKGNETPAVPSANTESIPQAAGLGLLKSGSLALGSNGIADPGDLIDYTFTVSNTGNVTLTNLAVTDPMVSPITCPSGNPIPSLPVSGSEVCTGSYAITQADIDAGQKVNTASANSNETAPVPSMNTVTIPQAPGLGLVKDGTLDLGSNGSADPGDLIDYTFTVSNTGNVTLTNLAVTDPMVSPITCPSGNPIPSLPVSGSEVCAGSYAITQADIDVGQKANTASANSNETAPVLSMNTETIPQAPGLGLVKDGTLDPGSNGSADPGDLIDYTFTVSNTGNVTLTNITVTDPMVSPINCPSGNPIPSLPVSGSEVCTGDYAIIPADIDAGQKVNTASADSNETVSVDASHTESIMTSADLRLTKTVDPAQVPPGGTLEFTVLVENLGPSTASAVEVVDALPDRLIWQSDTCGAGPPSSGQLVWSVGDVAPNASSSCAITVRVEPGPGEILSNTAQAGSRTSDPSPENATGTAEVTVQSPVIPTSNALTIAVLAVLLAGVCLVSLRRH